jgi:glycosyltransferase involved in cell wall biosynthesis
VSEISVVVCTHNPRADYLDRALRALDRQTFATDQWELIVVDNNSEPPLSKDSLQRSLKRTFELIRENRQGLIHARVCGIRVTTAPLIVFVDDDNEPSDDYLATA